MTPLRDPVALVLVNLGTPANPTPQAVRRFLREFLSDRRVVDLPRVFWLPLLYGIILPFRAARVAKLYQHIWWPDGSPLEVITRRQVQALQMLYQHRGLPVTVCHAMVYGEPSLQQALTRLDQQGLSRVVILPLYPQFCSATTGSVCDQLQQARKTLPSQMRISMIKDYFDNQQYIAALAESVRAHWAQQGRAKKLLFSFHGIPQSLADRGDPYFHQCHQTATKIAEALALSSAEWVICFQSRFGKAKWVQPYTDQVITECARAGLDTLDIMSPAFASDCLETLEEISVQLHELFIAAGGKHLRRIPCLNDDAAHIGMMAQLLEHHLDEPASTLENFSCNL